MEGYARDYGLDFYPTIFELVDADQLNAMAAYGGFPTRYPHWRFGMEYEQLSKGYTYGLQKIYELVINNNPCYAYLMRSNGLVDQKLVMAHVYGHCDFFKNNYWFSQTDRKMMDQMANHGNRVRRYMDRFGVEEVETFIDACLSIEDLIDIHSPFIKRFDERRQVRLRQGADHEEEPPTRRPLPVEGLHGVVHQPAATSCRPRPTNCRRQQQRRSAQFPAEPVRDVMLFVLENAPLKPWQLDVLSIVRDEAYYFAPQAQTKIMNEGWASYWHSTIMTRQGLEAADVVCYCDHHSGTLASSPDEAESVQARHRAVSRHRRSLEPRPLRQGIRRVRRPGRQARLGHRRRAGASKDLRGPQDPQRSDVHRRVPDARFLPAVQAVLVRLQRRAAMPTKSRAASSPRSSSSCCSA